MDQKLFLLINGVWTNPALDRFMAAMSSLDAWAPLLILAAVLALWRGGFRARSFVILAALTVALADGGISNPLKHLVGRPRPADVWEGVRLVDLAKATPRFLALFKPPKVRYSDAPPAVPPSGRSFPSSHTSNTMAIAVLAAIFYRRWGWSAIIVSLLVGYSRLYTGAHWPSDVLASIFLGAGLGLGCACAAEWGWRRWRGGSLLRSPVSGLESRVSS